MPRTSTKLRALAARFDGRITFDHNAHREFTGNPPVMIPRTSREVARALDLASAAGLRAFARSGRHTTGGTVTEEAATAVISLEHLSDVSVDLDRITVGAGTTLGDLAMHLAHRPIFLPLRDLPSRSVASALLGDHRYPFPRSGGTLALADGVISVEIVPFNEEGPDGPVTLDERGWRAFRSGPRAGVITRAVLDASRWEKFATHRWLRVWLARYSPESFGAVCASLFSQGVPAGVDLTARVSVDTFGAKILVVRATGQGRARSEASRRHVERAMKTGNVAILWTRLVEGAGAVVAAWVGTGPGRASSADDDTRYRGDLEWQDDESAYLADVERLLDAGGWAELHAGSLERRALVPAAGLLAKGSLVPAPQAPVPLTLVAKPVNGFALEASSVGGPIPGFRGQVFESAVGDSGYRRAINQYATSSYDPATVAQRMSPQVVAIPRDVDDVLRAVEWAASKKLKVVGRSGGHQYCGLSSGGDDTVVVDLSLFRKLEIHGNRATVGPGVRLEDLNKHLEAAHVAIPHGECPHVNLGGHVQTGGVGHQLRSLGLALDWVRSFRLVSWDVDGLAEREFVRPKQNVTTAANDDVFCAVLGGGPGSWGILTEVTFDLVKDGDWPESEGISRNWPYNRPGWAAAMEQMRQWSEREANGSLPEGVDLFVSVISGSYELSPNSNLRPAVLLVEMTSLTTENVSELRDVERAVEDETPFFDGIGGKAADLLTSAPNGPTRLSRIVAHGVRSTSTLGGMPGGREFDLPYKKSLYITRDPLPKDFCTRFIDLVDRVNTNPKTKVVFQGVIGGGRFQENGANQTSRMQLRDALVQIVFDVFYEPGNVEMAVEYQEQMRRLWLRYFPDETRRMFWGTYEDAGTGGSQLEMHRQDTQALYYDSSREYAELRAVKGRLDPHGVFRTSFTVQ